MDGPYSITGTCDFSIKTQRKVSPKVWLFYLVKRLRGERFRASVTLSDKGEGGQNWRENRYVI